MEAIDHLSKNNFNVVLLDLLMPKKSGHDVLDYIKKSNSDVDVIILSGCTDFERTVSLLGIKFLDICLNPINQRNYSTQSRTLSRNSGLHLRIAMNHGYWKAQKHFTVS